MASLHPLPMEGTQARWLHMDSQTDSKSPEKVRGDRTCSGKLRSCGASVSASSHPTDATVVAIQSDGPRGPDATHEKVDDDKHENQVQVDPSHIEVGNEHVRSAVDYCDGDDDEASRGAAKRARTSLAGEMVPQSQLNLPNPNLGVDEIHTKPTRNSALMALMNAASMAAGSEDSVDCQGLPNAQHLDTVCNPPHLPGAGLSAAAAPMPLGATVHPPGFVAGWNGQVRRARASSHGSSGSTHSAQGAHAGHDRESKDKDSTAAGEESDNDDIDNGSESSAPGGQLAFGSSRDEFMRTTSFVRKLYDIFDNPAFNPSLVHWSEDGKSIHFASKQSIETKILPVYFKHGNFRSMCRQLNSYCFQKIFNSEGSIEFRHPLFQRGREDLLHQIIRKDARKPNHLQPPPSHLPTHLPPGRGGAGAPSAVAAQQDRLCMVHLQREGLGFSSSTRTTTSYPHSRSSDSDSSSSRNNNNDFTAHLMIPPGLTLPQPDPLGAASSFESTGATSGLSGDSGGSDRATSPSQADKLRRDNAYLAAELRTQAAQVAAVTAVASARQEQLEGCYQQQQVLVLERDQAADACQQLQRQAAALTRELNLARQERDMAMLQSSMAASMHAQPHHGMQQPLLQWQLMQQQPRQQPQYAPHVPHTSNNQHAPSLMRGLPHHQQVQPRQSLQPQHAQPQHVQQPPPPHALGYHQNPSLGQGPPPHQPPMHNFLAMAPPGQFGAHLLPIASSGSVPCSDHHHVLQSPSVAEHGASTASSSSGRGTDTTATNTGTGGMYNDARATETQQAGGPGPTISSVAL